MKVSEKDKEIEKLLKRRFWKKWELLKMIKQAKEEAESSLALDVHLLKENKTSKEFQKTLIDNERSPEKKRNSEILYAKNCEFEIILNMLGFVDIAALDLFTIMRNLLKAKSDWDRRFFAREACMILYELTNDILEMLGDDKDKNQVKRGVNPIVVAINDANLSQLQNEVRAQFNEFKGKIGAKGRNYSEVRNISVAHKDHDFQAQYDSINEVSWGEVVEDFRAFMNMFYYLRLFNKSMTSHYSMKYHQDVQPVLDFVKSGRAGHRDTGNRDSHGRNSKKDVMTTNDDGIKE